MVEWVYEYDLDTHCIESISVDELIDNIPYYFFKGVMILPLDSSCPAFEIKNIINDVILCNKSMDASLLLDVKHKLTSEKIKMCYFGEYFKDEYAEYTKSLFLVCDGKDFRMHERHLKLKSILE